eukprot:SAG31_NODE_3753_length_3920_cov_7.141848_2_plen_330_part_00
MFFEKHSAVLDKPVLKYWYRVPGYLNEQIGPQNTRYLGTTTKVPVPRTQVPKPTCLPACLPACLPQTPLLDLQSAPNVTNTFPGLQNVLISDYASADWLKPHFIDAAASGVIGVNCSTPNCVLDAVSISSAGYPPGIPAIRVYAGRVTGTTINGGDSETWSVGGVVNEAGLPTGTFKKARQAGWSMSGPMRQGNGELTEALSFTVSGEKNPRKVIRVDGSVEYFKPEALEAEIDEPPTILQRHISAKELWDPPVLHPQRATTRVVKLVGSRQGDVVFAAHDALAPRLFRLQLTAIAGDGEVEAVLSNVGNESYDVPMGELRLVVMQMGW